jgi:hypothetical protein
MKTTAQRPAKARPRLSLSQTILKDFIAGAPVERIAKKLGLSPTRVEKILGQELKTLAILPAANFVNVQLVRIERMLGGLANSIRNGNPGAIGLYIKTVDRAERLYSLLKRLGIERESSENEGREAVDKVTRLMLAINPAALDEKS